MRRRALLVLGFAVLIPVAAVGLGQQPPGPPPPRTLPPSVTGAQPPAAPVSPAGGVTKTPLSTTESALAKFEPLAAFPPTTQHAVRSVLLGAGWLTRTNQP